MKAILILFLATTISLTVAVRAELIVRQGIDHETFENLLDEYRPKGQPWIDYTNWKNHLAGFPKKLPADIEIRALSDLSLWILYVPSAHQVVIGPEREVKKFARKTWK